MKAVREWLTIGFYVAAILLWVGEKHLSSINCLMFVAVNQLSEIRRK